MGGGERRRGEEGRRRLRMSTLRSKVEDWSLRMSTLRGNVEYRLSFACVLSGVVDLAVSKTTCFYSNNESDL